jgi:hypothetical protein
MVFEVGEGLGGLSRSGSGVSVWKEREGRRKCWFCSVFTPLLRGIEGVVLCRKTRGRTELFQRVQCIGREGKEGSGEVGPRRRRTQGGVGSCVEEEREGELGTGGSKEKESVLLSSTGSRSYRQETEERVEWKEAKKERKKRENCSSMRPESFSESEDG